MCMWDVQIGCDNFRAALPISLQTWKCSSVVYMLKCLTHAVLVFKSQTAIVLHMWCLKWHREKGKVMSNDL